MNINEERMLSNIEKNINSDFFIQKLKNNFEKYHQIHYVGRLIGELYIHHIIHKDGFGFEEYMNDMEELYTKYYERQISPEQFERERSIFIATIIAKKLNIDIKQVSQEDLSNIKNYFLNEYVTNGYVSHSFPDAYYESIMKDGLIASTDDRSEKPQDIQEIQNIFMSKGVITPMGGYPYYGGTGIYYEPDFTSMFQHAIDAPEWFAWFTSSNHSSAYQKDVETIPYVLRSEKDCRVNVEDLCTNSELSEEETKKVLEFYEQQYNKFSSPKLNVALIPKSVVGKDNIKATETQDLDLISTISFVLKDGAKQYKEHVGNVSQETIPPQNFKVSVIPSADKYMYATNYYRETKENLLNNENSLATLENIEHNLDRVTPSMIPKLKEIRQLLMSYLEQTKNNVEQQEEVNSGMHR